ncbi:hypothetical protein D9M72_567910 [compost metagenome]
MDTRIGYPNEHLAGNSDEEISSPLYATAVGLVMNSIRNNTRSAVPFNQTEVEKVVPVQMQQKEVVAETNHYEEEIIEEEVPKKVEQAKTVSTEGRMKKSFFDKYIDKIKEFLDNAE